MGIGYLFNNKRNNGTIIQDKKGYFVACSNPDLKPSLEYLNALRKIKPSDIQKGIKKLSSSKLEKELKNE
ncbi:hypothetical protein KAJ87_04555 [Candidatus Pacearchaeota archaeon]|nr:hypothetical protein [Candidatus Pacearchaeota archaeon]